MRDFYFAINPVETRPEKNMRVFSVEKTRKQEGYKAFADMAESYEKAKEQQSARERAGSMIYEKEHDRSKEVLPKLQLELMKGGEESLKEREEQLQCRKRSQETNSRRQQMLAAYRRD